MKILAFDLSTNTGFAVVQRGKLLRHGLIQVKIEGWVSDVSKTEHFPPWFPMNFAAAVESMVAQCLVIIEEVKPDLVVTEFIEGSSHRFSQMFLDWLHLDFHRMVKATGIQFQYLLNSDWRNHVGCWVSQHPDVKRWNAKVGRAKRVATPVVYKNAKGKEVKSRRAKIDGKVVARIDQKKLSQLLAAEHFDIVVDDDNVADALNIARAAEKIWST